MIGPDRARGDGGQRFFSGDGRPPLSPRRAKSETSLRFPHFDAAESARPMDNLAAAAARDEKLAQASNVRRGKGTVVSDSGRVGKPGHLRGSSYGHVEDTGRR